ncbi:AAA family ATPase [Cumulibacter manganitolerans]|uniref:AAA family ATPase n=1 Tax=Cumulibacter manganitolerans TaxID=1884992 RepID=UPI001294D2AB|nr:AAA family ATPase [Cumulibacter manganitolerans]
MPTYDLSAIADQLAAHRIPGSPLVVALDGPSGAGKSRLSRRIAKALGPSTVVRMDHVVPGWDGLEESVRLIRPVLARLRAGRPATYRTWDWARDGWGAELHRSPAGTVVLEGCGSGARSLADLVDALVWVEAPPQLRRDRAIERDGPSYAANWARWARQEEAHFAANATRERADVIIDGRYPVR